MERLFQILSVLLAGAAGYFYWKGMPDAALVAFVFACIVFLLNIRLQAGSNNKLRIQEQLEAAEEAEAANGSISDENPSHDKTGLDNPT